MRKVSRQILVISASPRRGGNSDTLCDEFIRGATEAGNIVEKIFLRDQNTCYCIGCSVCNNTHKCVQKDDMADILDKMVKADVIVFATPVYFYTMDGQLKTLIDRTVPRYTEISGKEFSQSMLSFGEITVIKSVFKEKLANVYHSRIEYPERK